MTDDSRCTLYLERNPLGRKTNMAMDFGLTRFLCKSYTARDWGLKAFSAVQIYGIPSKECTRHPKIILACGSCNDLLLLMMCQNGVLNVPRRRSAGRMEFNPPLFWPDILVSWGLFKLTMVLRSVRRTKSVEPLVEMNRGIS